MKFRSWFEDDNEFSFYYFEDGFYYEDEKCIIPLKEIGIILPLFIMNFWSNAEQFLTECDDDVFYFNDKVKCKVFSDFTKEDEIVGILKSDKSGIYIDDGICKYRYYNMSAAEVFIKLGNIHEEQQNDQNRQI